jgi:hypothetical protein
MESQTYSQSQSQMEMQKEIQMQKKGEVLARCARSTLRI